MSAESLTKARRLGPSELGVVVDDLHDRGLRVVQCHGVFDLLHVGHIRHLEAAREHGDALIVTVTADEFVNRGPGHPALPLELRMETLAALHCVDYVTASRWPTAVETIRRFRPDLYARGPNYRGHGGSVDPGLDVELEAVAQVGGRFIITDDIPHSLSGLINRRASLFSEETRDYLVAFRQRYSLEAVLGWIEAVRGLRVVVIGEPILDDYRYVTAIGKSSKDPVLAARHLSTETFAGGSLAVANNVMNFAGGVDLISFLGTENSHENFVRSRLHTQIGSTFLAWPGAPTIVKRRYIEGYSFTKLFEVYEMADTDLPPRESAELCRILRRRLPDYDLAIVVDFGHGMIGPEARDILCEHSRFLALNVQANAGNRGFHSLSKYRHADYVSTAEEEIRLNARDRRGELRTMIGALAASMGPSKVSVTRGKYGCLCLSNDGGTVEIPALAHDVVDRVGAGDAFLAVSSLVAMSGAPAELVGFIGGAASAQAVATVGHRRAVDRQRLIDHIEMLLR